MVEFLKKELDVRERLTLLYKSKKSLGIHLKDSKDHKKSNTGSRYVYSNKTKCHICDKLGHAVVTNCKGRDDVPYFACKKFVEMTNEDRWKILFEKRLCAQCLEPGVKCVQISFTIDLKVVFMY